MLPLVLRSQRSREDKEMKECDTGPKPAKKTSRSLRTGFPMDLVLTERTPPTDEKQLPPASCPEGDRWTSSAKEGLQVAGGAAADTGRLPPERAGGEASCWPPRRDAQGDGMETLFSALGVEGAGPTPQFSAPEIKRASRGRNRQSPCLTCSPFPAPPVHFPGLAGWRSGT